MQSRRNLSSEHDRHDRLLVARYAAGDAYESEIVEAKDLVDNCDRCASLAADIKLISAKTADLSAATRPRDFRISHEQAEKLRGSWFDRLMRSFSSPGWSVVRPIAAASLAIGMVLIVVGALPISLTGGTSPEAVSGQNHGSYGYPGSGVPLATSMPANAPAAAASAAPASAAASVTPQLAPAASGIPGAGGLSGTFGAVDSASSMAASTAGPNPEANQDNQSPEPPRLASSAPPATEGTGKAVAGPSAPPADLGGAVYGQAQVGSVSESTFDRSSLVLIGIVIAFFALIALVLVWLARRRSSDPLVR